jgi:hypothetical protein
MTTQVIDVGRPRVRMQASRRPLVSVGGSRDVIRLALAVIVLALGLCLAGTFASVGSIGMPQDGPAPGFDL